MVTLPCSTSDKDSIDQTDKVNLDKNNQSSGSSKSSSTGNLDRTDNQTTEKVLIPDSKNIMRRQRSDLSENLFISSTPEAERYFERKKESLNEKVARGELDIEIIAVETNNNRSEHSVELLQVLDEETLDVMTGNTDTTCENVRIALEGQVENIEQDVSEHIYQKDLVVALDDNFKPISGSQSPGATCSLSSPVIPEEATQVEYVEVLTVEKSPNENEEGSYEVLQVLDEDHIKLLPVQLDTTFEGVRMTLDDQVQKLENDVSESQCQQNLVVSSDKKVLTRNVLPSSEAATDFSSINVSEESAQMENLEITTLFKRDNTSEDSFEVLQVPDEENLESLAVNSDPVSEVVEIGINNQEDTMVNKMTQPEYQQEIMIVQDHIERLESVPQSSEEAIGLSCTKSFKESVNPGCVEVMTVSEKDNTSKEGSIEVLQVLDKEPLEILPVQLDSPFQEKNIQIDDKVQKQEEDLSKVQYQCTQYQCNINDETITEETVTHEAITKASEVLIPDTSATDVEDLEDRMENTAFTDKTAGEAVDESIWKDVSTIDNLPVQHVIESSPMSFRSDSNASSDFDVNKYKVSALAAENVQHIPLTKETEEGRDTLSPLDTNTIDISGLKEISIDSTLEEMNVGPDTQHISKLTVDSKRKSSSFEALYDSAQIDTVSSGEPLPSSDIDNTPIVGDHFVGTFKNSCFTSSFEDLYRRSSFIGEDEEGCTPSILDSEMGQFVNVLEDADKSHDEGLASPDVVVEKKESTPTYHEWSENRWSESDPNNLVDTVEMQLDIISVDGQSDDPESDSIHSDTLKESLREENSTLTETIDTVTLIEEESVAALDLEKQIPEENVFVRTKSEVEVVKEMFIPMSSSEPQDIPKSVSGASKTISITAALRGDIKPESLASSVQSEQSYHIELEKKHFFPDSSPDSPSTVRSSSHGSTRGSSQIDSNNDRRSESQESSAIDIELQGETITFLDMEDIEAEEKQPQDVPFEINMKGNTFFPSLSQDTTPRTESVCSPRTIDSSDSKSEGERNRG